MRKVSSFRGSSGIGRSSKAARWPRTVPSESHSGTPRKLSIPHDQRVRVVREFLPYSRGVVAQIPVNHVFTRRARQSPFEIFNDAVPVPEGDGTGLDMVLRRCELRDECPARVNHTCQVRTSAWKYSSPLLREAASTIARSAVSSSASPRDTSSGTFEVARFSAALPEALCVWAIDTCLTFSWSRGERGAAALVKELRPTKNGPDPSEHDPQRPGAGRHFIQAIPSRLPRHVVSCHEIPWL